MEKDDTSRGIVPKGEASALNKQKKEKKYGKAEAKAARIEKVKRKQADLEKIWKIAYGETKNIKHSAKKLHLKKLYLNTTPKGEKKDLSNDETFLLESDYDPSAVEAAWYDWWDAQGYFKPEYNTDPHAEKFVIVTIPPPNVTGSLHLGHALTVSIQDALVRWHRMNGKKVLWVPSMDHAGIVTQTAIENRLRKDGLTRHDLGREKLLEKAQEWKTEHRERIVHQLRRLGSSLDWSREAFTIDEKMPRAVNEAFVRLYDMGLIYRANKLVNWCCNLKTAISDFEVESEELEKKTKKRVPGYDKECEFGLVYKFCYQVEGSEELLEMSTTRPETMLGDTAVAVHPDDPRYKHLHGKYLVHPFVSRRIPIITDTILVDISLGTGVVKVTPAHDQNDFECGKRHSLPMINILNDNGCINENGGDFRGMKRFEARDAIVAALEKLGHFKGSSPYKMILKTCSRSGDIIEPRLKPHWWMNCQHAAQHAADAVKNKQLDILPARYTRTWFAYLRDVRDWCISRRLWWGHRIPAWLVTLHGQPTNHTDLNCWIVARDESDARAKAEVEFGADKVASLEQDPDVLDAWFCAFGWPDNTPDLQQFYPTQLLATGKDIPFFWLMRMVMLGLTLTDQLPFKQVFLHPIVHNAQGLKMTGNLSDPLDLIEGKTLQQLHDILRERKDLHPLYIEEAMKLQKRDFPNGISECGSDALRFALCSYIRGRGNNIHLDINLVVSYRHFCNKLWQATKLTFTLLGSDFILTNYDETKRTGHESEWDMWILGRLQCAVEDANKGFESYELSDSTRAIYRFWLNDFCCVYLEAVKPLMAAKSPVSSQARDTIKHTLFVCLEVGFRMLHPYMPFLTEELWQRLTRKSQDQFAPSLCVAKYPRTISERSIKVEDDIEQVMQIVHEVRKVRQMYRLKGSDRPLLVINTHSERDRELFSSHEFILAIQSLARVSNITVTFNELQPPLDATSVILKNDMEIYVVIKDVVVDLTTEISNQIKTLEDQINALEKKRADPSWESKTPAKVKEGLETKFNAINRDLINAHIVVQKLKGAKVDS